MAKFKKGDDVYVLRNISRQENKDYAKAGDKGTIIDVFPTTGGSADSYAEKRWNAKVQIGNEIKTFRFSSLAKSK